MTRDDDHPRLPFMPLAAFVACLLAAAPAALADDYERFPGAPIDQRMQRIQQQVEELYDDGDYERALLIYEKELAPDGDKYAQYMVGYMTLTGRGVEEDTAEALAWYRLAAERGGSPYVRARDALAARLSAEERRRAAERHAALSRELGDRRLLMKLLREDLDTLALYDALPPDDPQSNRTLASGFLGGNARLAAYRRIRDRIETRLEYLDAMPASPAAGDGGHDGELAELEAALRDEIAALPGY